MKIEAKMWKENEKEYQHHLHQIDSRIPEPLKEAGRKIVNSTVSAAKVISENINHLNEKYGIDEKVIPFN